MDFKIPEYFSRIIREVDAKNSNDINKAIPKYEAYLITKTAMKLNTIYSVRVSGKSNDTPFTRNWSFTTDRVQIQ